jgi:hypothetical protein
MPWQTTLPAFSFALPAVARDAVAVPGADGTLHTRPVGTRPR